MQVPVLHAVNIRASGQREDPAGGSSLLPSSFLERAGAVHLLAAPRHILASPGLAS